MQVIVAKDNAQIAEIVGEIFVKTVQENPACTLGLATGSSPEGVYAYMVEAGRQGRVDYSKVHSVNLDEYIGLSPEHDQSYRYFMNCHLFDHINIDKANTYVASGLGEPEECVRQFQSVIDSNDRDIQLLGIGEDGHIAFNEPGEVLHADAHIEALTESTISANARFFASADEVPKTAISMGIGDIMKAKRIVLIASGPKKADAIRGLIMNDDITVQNPSTFLKLHRDVTVVIDEQLAQLVGYCK